jgi:hypothetical protein
MRTLRRLADVIAPISIGPPSLLDNHLRKRRLRYVGHYLYLTDRRSPQHITGLDMSRGWVEPHGAPYDAREPRSQEKHLVTQ